MLSVGAAFAADNATDVVAADEITIDEPLAVDEDVQVLSEDESIVVTNDNLDEYVSSSGTINENITADELIFKGNFENLNLSVDRPIKLTGDEATLINPDIEIYASNTTFSGFTINQSKHINAIFVGGSEDAPISDVTISDVKIDFKDIGEAPENIAIEVINTNYFNLINSVINYVGATNGSYVNNAINVKNSNESRISGNKFNISLVSCYVPWAEEPAGSGNWVSSPASEGIVIDSSVGVGLQNNTIDVNYNSIIGDYDTIYAVDFKNSDYAMVENNTINALGHTYIYGVIISGDNFNINNNVISTESDSYYANGIDIEGPANGIVDSNVISAKGVVSAYPIYSGMNGQDVGAVYIDNELKGEAYLVIGMSLGDVNNMIVGNEINLNGNYTTGIAYKGANTTISNNHIVLTSSEQGNQTVWEAFGVEAVGIKIIGSNAEIDNNTIATSGKGVSLAGNSSDVSLTNNFINVVANDDKDAYAIYSSEVGDLTIFNNTVDYQGTTKGTGINYGVLIDGTDDAIIGSNKFILELVSAPVGWAEVPAGSGNWVSSPITEGVVVKNSKGVVFDSNAVNATFGDVSGSYDTIYVIDFSGSDDAVIANNDINANGNTYIYGIIISGKDFIIRANNISSTGVYYANGIDVEGPATGVIEDNGILAKAGSLAYPIYSGMNGQEVKVNYTGNDLVGDAYFVLGMSLGDVESVVDNGNIELKGNYTTGIAFKGSKLSVTDVAIIANGSNVGNESIWESFGVETVGVKVLSGVATIKNNNVQSTGQYTVKVENTNSTVTDNFLVANETVGDSSVNYTGDAVVKDNRGISTDLSYSSSKTVLLTAIKKGSYFNIVLKDDKGNVLANKNVTIKFNGKTSVAVTDKNGAIKYKLAATKTGTKKLTMNFAGEGDYDAVVGEATIKITKQKTKLTAKKKTFKASTKTKKYTITLKDSKKAIKKVKVTIKVKGKTYKAKTNSKGKATFKITKLTKKGKYSAKVKFAGNTYYKAAKKTVKITVKK